VQTQAQFQPFDEEGFYYDTPQNEWGTEAVSLLEAARLALVMDHPFFGQVALNLAFYENNNIPTTAVDARGNFYFNRRWVNHYRKKDAIFSMAHEVMHLVQRFFDRKPPGANHMLWNLAADYVLEVNLIDMGFEQSKNSLRKTTPTVQAMVREVGETVPAVYRHLLEEMDDQTDCKACKAEAKKLKEQSEKNKKEGQRQNAEMNGNEPDEGEGESDSEGDSGESSAGGPGDGPEHTCGKQGAPCCSGSLSDTGEMDPGEQQKWTEIVVGAKIHAEAKGNMPAGLGSSIDELTKSKVRWQDHLKAAATRLFGRDRYSYRRRNRRGHFGAIALPGHTPDGKTAIAGIDTSNSMSPDEVRQCLSEFSAIMKACGCDKMWLILHDSRVFYSGWVKEADLTKLKMARGGTSHSEVFACLDRTHPNEDFNIPKDEEVKLAILFTDLGTDFPSTPPSFDVIWGVPTDGCPGLACPVPFGIKVPVDMS
jgi:predicted metal-dependent peptidase